MAIPLQCLNDVSARAAALFGPDLAADGGAVGGLGVAGFGGGLVEAEGFFGVVGEVKGAGAERVGLKEHRVWVGGAGEANDYFGGFLGVAGAVCFFGAGVGAAVVVGEGFGRFDEGLGEFELRSAVAWSGVCGLTCALQIILCDRSGIAAISRLRSGACFLSRWRRVLTNWRRSVWLTVRSLQARPNWQRLRCISVRW